MLPEVREGQDHIAGHASTEAIGHILGVSLLVEQSSSGFRLHDGIAGTARRRMTVLPTRVHAELDQGLRLTAPRAGQLGSHLETLVLAARPTRLAARTVARCGSRVEVEVLEGPLFPARRACADAIDNDRRVFSRPSIASAS